MPTGSSIEIIQFSCLSDNFGLLIHDADQNLTIAVDVPEAAPYLRHLKERDWTLNEILITHHHWDHVQGLDELKAATGAHVTGPALSRDKIEGLDAFVEDGDTITLGDWEVEAIGTPGHTLDQISWYIPTLKLAHTGDTLFSLGCGRVFEGDLPMMWASLARLKERLPADTRIYCGHEYTQTNARFSLTIEPENEALKIRAAEVDRLRAQGRPTLPTTMEQELATNPFLRADQPGVKAALAMSGASDAEVFAEIRTRKDKA
ncbi:hydroxyacylglutathione hydrolase [Roseibium aestuarii]|uniref:Hydroxyacylglutathione hydrolase n=1 Tax=Roseibium aestuarii TaxID=2600299 RepID=A0ABW4K4T5_9HYPH|nr:hydroxyacylglutathione hydrolase [Roseibium aestuarii]